MRRQAFGIAETLIASAMIAMVIMGLYAISANSARAAQLQGDRVTAAALAEESLDVIRFERERFWRGLAGSSNPGRTAAGFWTYLGSTAGAAVGANQINWTDMSVGWSDLSVVTGFARSLQISQDVPAIQNNLTYQDAVSGAATVFDAAKANQAGASLLKVTVTVSWSSATGPESYILTTYLSDWLEGML